MNNKNIIILIIGVIIIASLGFKLNKVSNEYKELLNENNKNIEVIKELTEENRELLSKVSSNKESEDIKLVSENFLRGMFEYDEKTDRRANIRDYVTNEFYNKYNLAPAETEIKYKSTYDKAEIYVTDVGEGKVLARVWYSFEINNARTTTQTLLTLNLIKENDKYLVHSMEIQGTMNEKGFLN